MASNKTHKADPKFFGPPKSLTHDQLKQGDLVVCNAKTTTICRVLKVTRQFFELKDDFTEELVKQGADIGDEMSPLLHLDVLGSITYLHKNTARTTFKTKASNCTIFDRACFDDLQRRQGTFIGYLSQLVPK